MENRSSVAAELIGHNVGIAKAKDGEDRRVARLDQCSNPLDEIVRNAELILPRRCIDRADSSTDRGPADRPGRGSRASRSCRDVWPELPGIPFPVGTEIASQEESTPMRDRVEFIPVCLSLETSTIRSDATSHSTPDVFRLLPVSKS